MKRKTIPLDRAIDELRRYRPELERRYKVKTLGVFGSYIRGEQQKRSDLDLLVEFHDPPSLLKFIEMEHYLSDLLGVKVDLVMKDALKPAIGKRVLNEVIAV
jgi:predicted nucleotidyltransferase